MEIPPIRPQTGSQPIYEVIKREDLVSAFQDALERALTTILARIDVFIDTYSNIVTPSLWTWDATSRWDYDSWW